MTLSKVGFRNVSSDKQPPARRAPSRKPQAPGALAPDALARVPDAPRPPTAAADASPAPEAYPAGEMGIHKITDARAMRALAHPLRLALLEALAHAGTLTATQASELLGESPANCAFHLRTLAKYGYVAEAGGGKGRERPWRRTHNVLQITSDQEDPLAAMAADQLGQYWLDMVLDRARTALASEGSWPAGWRHNLLLGQSEHILYVTPQEASELGSDIYRLLRRFDDRVDHPERRPADAMPIETLQLSYPLLHLASWPAPGGEPQPATEPPEPPE
jgi:DNA-binding transcriptional ArsR family regulator